MRAPRGALGLYLIIEAPGDRLVVGFRGPGVISQDGGGLALLGGGAKTVTRVESYGEGDAERLLLRLVQEWKARGRPTGEDLRVEVGFGGGAGSGVSLSWRASLSSA